MSKKKKLAALCYAFPRTMPVMAGYLVLGAAYGILMNVNGYGIWWALLISVFVYAGSLQYLGITFFCGGSESMVRLFYVLDAQCETFILRAFHAGQI